MATLSGALALINTITDGGANTAAKVRSVLSYLAVLAENTGGGSAQYLDVTIDSSTDGPTYEVEGASASYQVVKNGVTLVPGTGYTFAAGVWTFAEDLIVGDEMLFIYE